jgi:hypothetical protein
MPNIGKQGKVAGLGDMARTQEWEAALRNTWWPCVALRTCWWPCVALAQPCQRAPGQGILLCWPCLACVCCTHRVWAGFAMWAVGALQQTLQQGVRRWVCSAACLHACSKWATTCCTPAHNRPSPQARELHDAVIPAAHGVWMGHQLHCAAACCPVQAVAELLLPYLLIERARQRLIAVYPRVPAPRLLVWMYKRAYRPGAETRHHMQCVRRLASCHHPLC